VKTQPGIQNYVHLEFTQRALDFWEETPSSDRGNSTGKVAVITAPLTAAPAVPMPLASGLRQSGSTTEETQPREKSSGSAASPKVTPLADIPAADSQAAPKQAPAAPSKLSEISASRAPAHQQPHAAPFHSPRLQPFERVISQDKKGAKAIGSQPYSRRKRKSDRSPFPGRI
jgi:hypothetical protein